MQIAGLKIDAVVTAMGCPTDDWHARCSEVAHALLKTKLVEGRYAYGHYLGPVAPTGYWASRRGFKFIRHAWVWGEDGAVYDPTRWSFTDSEPCVAVIGPDDPRFDQYDEGGTQWVKSRRNGRKPRCPKPSEHPLQGKLVELPPELSPWRESLGLPNPAAINQLHWAANLLPEEHGEYVLPFYRWLRDDNETLIGLVPWDFRVMSGLDSA